MLIKGEIIINYLSKYDSLRENDIDYSLSYNTDQVLYELYRSISSDEIYYSLNKYPKLAYQDMQQLIQKRYHVHNVLFGTGSEELIVRINQEVLREKRVAVVVPTFYRVLESLETPPICLNINTFYHKQIFLHEKFEQHIKMLGVDAIWIANPNSTYGNAIIASQLLHVINKCFDVLFIIDEASIDFMMEIEKYELFQEAERHQNMIVVKTMSKYYGLPGLRLGMLSTNDALINRLQQRTCIYPVNNLSFLYLKKVLENEDTFLLLKENIRNNAKHLKELLIGTPIKMLDGMTNTAFLWMDGTRDLWELLKSYYIHTASLKEDVYVCKKNAVRLTIHSGKNFEHLYHQIKVMKREEFNG